MLNSPGEVPSLPGMPPEKGRWGLIVSGLVINLCLGTTYAWSVFVHPLTGYFTTHLGQTVTANDVLMPFSVILAVFAITMALTGTYVETHGPRKVTVIGCVLTGLAGSSRQRSLPCPCCASCTGDRGYRYRDCVRCNGRHRSPVVPGPEGPCCRPDRCSCRFSPAFITANLAGYFIALFGVMSTFRIFGAGIIIITVPLALPLTFPPAGWRPAG